MADTPPEEYDPKDLAQFSWEPRDGRDGPRRVVVSYRGIRMALTWQQGEAEHRDVLRFFGALPKIYAAACGEIELQRDLRSLDTELEQLLGEGDE